MDDTKTQNKQVVKTSGRISTQLKAEAFVRELKDNGYNATEAMLKIDPNVNSRQVASNKASTFIRSATVQELLRPLETEINGALKGMIRDVEHKDHFNANKLAMAYLYGTPVARSENVNVNVSLEDILKS